MTNKLVITESNTRTLKIVGGDRLDPITVFLEDLKLGEGKITVGCFDEEWSAYWNAMSGRTISNFFIDTDNDYLAKNLITGINSEVTDQEKSKEQIKKIIIEHRKSKELSDCEAREAWSEVERVENITEWTYMTGPLQEILYEGEPWHAEFPYKPNPSYTRLCRIIDTVKEALKTL